MRRGGRPSRWRTGDKRCGDGYVSRRREAKARASHSCWARRGIREVGTVSISGVLLFVGRKVAKVRLHRGDIRLFFGLGELRNRDRGKNADDDDYDQKLNKGKTLFVAHRWVS